MMKQDYLQNLCNLQVVLVKQLTNKSEPSEKRVNINYRK